MEDLVVIGGGLSGVSAAVFAARNGLKVTLIERNSFLGGSATAGLVVPMMKNICNGKSLNSSFFDELYEKLSLTSDSGTFKDGNKGWFNPEMMKCVLDDILEEAGVKVLFNSSVIDVSSQNDLIKELKIQTGAITSTISSKYFVDGTGNADLAYLAGCEFESGLNGVNQAVTLRFNMAGVDMEKFAEFLQEIDPNSEISPVYEAQNGEIMLSTAYTSEDKGWKLKPYFDLAIKNGDLKTCDADYFQLFSVVGQKGTIAFNCPRVNAQKPLNPLEPDDISTALTTARKQIRRIADFCKKYLKGFENAYISQIAPMLGVRDSRRVECKYKLTDEDVLKSRKFENPVASSNYPIDVHACGDLNGELTFLNENDFYQIPIEACQSKKYSNLYIVGRSICSTFHAQASLRIIPNCISIGENVGKFIAGLILL